MPARFVLCCLLGVCATLAAPVGMAQGAQEAASRAFADGTAAYAAQDYQRALAYFQDALDAGIQGPAVHYNIAVCQYRLGDYESAESEFSLIAARFPAMAELATYNLGLVAQKQGNDLAAEAYFRQVLEDTEDEKLRGLAASQLTPEAVDEPGRWYRQLNTRIGYDDNVRLVSDDVPLPAGQSAQSSSTEFWALVSGPMAAAPGFRLDASLYSVRYRDASFYDQNYLRLGMLYRWRWGNWLAETGPQFSYSTLDGDAYEERGGIAFRASRNINTRLTFRAQLSHDDVNAGDPRFDFVEGSREWLELSFDRHSARDRLTYSYAVESNDRGVNVASTRQKLSLRYRRAFATTWETDVSGSYRHSSYDRLAQPRDEDLTELSFGLTRNLARNWEVTGTLALADNSSVVPYSYDRGRFSIAVNKIFY